MIIWIIIGLIILVGLGNLAKIGFSKQASDTVEYLKEKKELDELNEDKDKIENDWSIRAKQLGVDLDKAKKVKYLFDYNKNKEIKDYIGFVYVWAVDGAIALFFTPEIYNNGIREDIGSSPLEWNIKYIEINQVRGVYCRNNVCEVQYNDGSCSGFSLEDYDIIKIHEEVYQYKT